MLDLVLAAMMSMLYTNDLFTAYVFIEIMTLTACALIMSRQNGRTMVSAMRYMIMSLLGSGLTLIAITITYNLTGHLLMENIHDSLMELVRIGRIHDAHHRHHGPVLRGSGHQKRPVPFHTWLPDAYGYSTPRPARCSPASSARPIFSCSSRSSTASSAWSWSPAAM